MSLKALAKTIYKLCRRDVWLGGKVVFRYENYEHVRYLPNWPKELPKIDWPNRLTWTLSPEVELGGHKLRVCVSWDGRPGGHGVRVFVDNELKHPGGYYAVANVWWNWSWKIARQENWEGGKDGPIDIGDKILADAKRQLAGVRTDETPDEGPVCRVCQQSLAEMDALDDPDHLEAEILALEAHDG